MSRLKIFSLLAGLSFCLHGGAADLAAGRAAFAQCMACHAADAGNNVGPGLGGVVGRVSGTQPGFRYSRAMKGAKLQWDEKSLDAFLENPQKTVPGNLMPFSGVADAAERSALVAYLATLK